MNLDDVVRDRRSVRSFLDRRVEKEKIEAILRCAALSPSAKNRQPWCFTVITYEAKNDLGRLLHERAASRIPYPIDRGGERVPALKGGTRVK